jgi:hypothetical protein
MGKRGRPTGFRLSEESKQAIRESKKGQRHRQETKDKISRSLVVYFRRKRPLSEEITNTYCRFDDAVLRDWVFKVSDALDETEDVLTERVMRNKNRIELTCGHNIELFSHDLNPEVLYLFKEYCELNGLLEDEALDEIL